MLQALNVNSIKLLSIFKGMSLFVWNNDVFHMKCYDNACCSFFFFAEHYIFWFASSRIFNNQEVGSYLFSSFIFSHYNFVGKYHSKRKKRAKVARIEVKVNKILHHYFSAFEENLARKEPIVAQIPLFLGCWKVAM